MNNNSKNCSVDPGIIILSIFLLSITGLILQTHISEAQTKPKVVDLRAPSSTTVNLLGFVNDATGKPALVNVTLGSGLKFSQNANGYQIDLANTTTSLTWASDSFLGTSGGGLSFTLFQTPNISSPLFVFKNGVLQANGPDFTLVGKTLTFTVGQGIGVDDIVQVKYQY